MEADSGIFMWMALVPTRRSHGLPRVVVPKAVIDELDRLASGTSIRSKRSNEAKVLLRGLIVGGEAECFGEGNDGPFADNVFVSTFTRLRLKYRLVLVTQDRDLAKDILSLNRSNSIGRICGIDAFRVGDRGYPERWVLSERSGIAHKTAVPTDGFVLRPPLDEIPSRQRFRDDTPTSRSQHLSRLNPQHSRRTPAEAPFSSGVTLAKIDNTPVATTSIPGIGDTVIDTNSRSFRLIEDIGKGGEGTVYATDQGLACKVYHHNRIFKHVMEKLRLMTTRTVSHPAICWPQSLIYNADRQFVGYIMPKATGKDLHRTVFIPPLLQERLPHWRRLHLVQLASKILEAIEFFTT